MGKIQKLEFVTYLKNNNKQFLNINKSFLMQESGLFHYLTIGKILNLIIYLRILLQKLSKNCQKLKSFFSDESKPEV